MSRDGLRVMVLAILSITMTVAAAFALPWFVAKLGAAHDISKITFDLREARACTALGECGVMPMSKLSGSYPASAKLVFFTSLIFAMLVLYQAGTRVIVGYANETVTRIGYVACTLVIIIAFATGYLFAPRFDGPMALGIEIERAWGPVAMFVAAIVGALALRSTKQDSEVPYKPIELAPAVTRAKTPTTPHPFTGKLQFAVATGEITVAGIDARREDGSTVLVLWRDVVGFVVRRLPPEMDGHPFVDIVSAQSMTLRIVPWSRLTGESIPGENEARVRAFIEHVVARCPEAKLDRATQAFVDGAKPPAQLANAEMLAMHDHVIA